MLLARPSSTCRSTPIRAHEEAKAIPAGRRRVLEARQDPRGGRRPGKTADIAPPTSRSPPLGRPLTPRDHERAVGEQSRSREANKRPSGEARRVSRRLLSLPNTAALRQELARVHTRQKNYDLPCLLEEALPSDAEPHILARLVEADLARARSGCASISRGARARPRDDESRCRWGVFCSEEFDQASRSSGQGLGHSPARDRQGGGTPQRSCSATRSTPEPCPPCRGRP